MFGIGLFIIAVLIISLLLLPVIGCQSCLANCVGEVSADEDLAGGGAVGVLVALLFLIGAAFAWGLPIVSVVSFSIAALFGWAVGATTEFNDMAVWGFAAAILAVMSFFGTREKKKKMEQA